MLRGKKDVFVRLKIKNGIPFKGAYLKPAALNKEITSKVYKELKDKTGIASVLKLEWREDKKEEEIGIGLKSFFSQRKFLNIDKENNLAFSGTDLSKDEQWFVSGSSLKSFALRYKGKRGSRISLKEKFYQRTYYNFETYTCHMVLGGNNLVAIFSMEIIDPESSILEPIKKEMIQIEEQKRKRNAFLAKKLNIADIANQKISIKSAFTGKYFRPVYHTHLKEWVIKADSSKPAPFRVYSKKWSGKRYIALRSGGAKNRFLESNKWGRKKYITLFSRKKIISARELWSLEGTFGKCKIKNLRTGGYLSTGNVKTVKLSIRKKTTISEGVGRISKSRDKKSELIIEKYPAKY